MESIAIRVHEGTVLSFDLSPDGRTIVFDLLGQLWQMPATGGDARPLTDAVRDTADDREPSFSPDGGRIVFRGERDGRTGLWLLEPGGTPRQLTQLANPDGYDGNAAWSPDGKGIAFLRLLLPDSASPRRRMRAMWLDLATRETRQLRVPDTVGRALRDLAWAPNGRRLAVVAAWPQLPVGGRLWFVEPDSGHATPVTPESSRALAPAFAPDGRRLAFFAPDSSERMQLWVLRLDTTSAAPMRVTDHADVTPTRVRWTSDGRRLVYTADGRLWSVAAAGGPPTEIAFTASLSFNRPRRELPPAPFPEPGKAQHARAFTGLALAPDGRHVAMLALGKLWVMPVGGTVRAVADVPLSARYLTWSPAGAVVWSAGRAGEENLFTTDVATGKSRQLTALPGRESAPAFAPNGQLLAFLYQPNEDTTQVRVIDPRGATINDARQGRTIPTESGADFAWTPASDGLLIMTGGFSPRSPTKATFVRLSGEQRSVSRMPDSPLSLQWTGRSIAYVRHARLWRARFDSTGMIGEPEPQGADPAMYASVATDGTVLYISEGGLRLRSPDGREQRLGWPVSYTPPVAAPLLIRNVRIIDGTGRPATDPQDVLLAGGKISKIAPAGTLQPGVKATLLDAGGRFVIPGLMDLHAHEYRPAMLPGFAYFGVMTIRDQGAPIGPLVAYADAIAAGKLDGPRVAFGGFQFYSDWAYDAEDQQGVEPEADPEHVARSVEMARVFGSEHIKTRTFRRWDINARMITEAHRRGMRVTGHCSHFLPLVAAGMDAKEHGGFCEPRSDGIIYDDMVQLYKAAGIGVVPTITYGAFAAAMNEHPDMLAADSDLAPFMPERGAFAWMLGLDSTDRRMFAGFGQSARLATAKLARAGVTIGTGTDIWQIPTGVHQELQELVAAGLSPLEAIHAATGASARIVGGEQAFGTIEVGKWADLVILDADPVADIRNSRRIWAVVQSGRMLDRAALVARIKNQE